MADAAIPEIKKPKEEAPKRGRPSKPKANITVTFQSTVSHDIPIPGEVLKSGARKTYPAMIGNAMRQSSQMKPYLDSGQIKVI